LSATKFTLVSRSLAASFLKTRTKPRVSRSAISSNNFETRFLGILQTFVTAIASRRFRRESGFRPPKKSLNGSRNTKERSGAVEVQHPIDSRIAGRGGVRSEFIPSPLPAPPGLHEGTRIVRPAGGEQKGGDRQKTGRRRERLRGHEAARERLRARTEISSARNETAPPTPHRWRGPNRSCGSGPGPAFPRTPTGSS